MKIVVGALFLFFLNAGIAGVVPEQLPRCMGCHGKEGKALQPDWPHIGGQHRSYLEKQLLDFKQNTSRKSAIMNAVVSTLTSVEIHELSVYYSAQPAKNKRLNEANRGQQLYLRGDSLKKITACAACHGANGQGIPSANFPALAGQNKLYIIKQLKEFQQKERSNDVNSIMRDISGRLDEQDMLNLADYLSR